MNNHFKCIGIVGHPRHPTALTTHEMLYRWLCTKGYDVIVERQIAQELKLDNVKTGTLAEIGQKADLAVVVGGGWEYARCCPHACALRRERYRH
ncbi:Probable inorganic polyphosphate/ATP-NAD kinase [Kluyvera intermedia]|nr:Probable inorganic polyphosphate/ATP-NAD kinase [Kluyvera intermedia]